MTRLIAALTLVALIASGCGFRDSSLNPRNWFGRDRNTQVVVVAGEPTVVDPRGIVNEIVALKVDRLPGGAIITAIGRPQSQGYYDGALVPVNAEQPDKGTLTYEFRLLPPKTQTAVGTPPSRELTVGRFVSDQTLQAVRRIEVIGQQNRRTVRR